MVLKEESIVVCKVKSIEGAAVFLDIEGGWEGSMTMSEVAAGRIRNLREYVFPNKQIVCKVLKIDSEGHAQLSLRRVTGKEREDAEKAYKKEKMFSEILKSITPKSKEIVEKIKEDYSISEFVDELSESPELLEKFLDKEKAKKVGEFIKEREKTEKTIKKEIILKTDSESGVKDIKEILSDNKLKINYLGSSKFVISSVAKDFKEANSLLNSSLEIISKRAKEKKAHFEVKEK